MPLMPIIDNSEPEADDRQMALLAAVVSSAGKGLAPSAITRDADAFLTWLKDRR